MNTGTGVSVLFYTGFLAEIMDVRLRGYSRKAINSSHAGLTVADTFIPSDRYDPGTLEVDLNFRPQTAPPITGAAETITVTFPYVTTPITFAGSGFLVDFSFGVPDEDKMTATAGIKLSGPWTWTTGG